MLFPHIPRSHTVTLIGWRGRRPVWVKDVVASWPGRVALTSDGLYGRSFPWGLDGRIEIPRAEIQDVRRSPRAAGLLEVRFGESRKSRLLRFMTRGELDGVVLLSLGDACGKWFEAMGGDQRDAP